jgi:hypothetical protein
VQNVQKLLLSVQKRIAHRPWKKEKIGKLAKVNTAIHVK